MLMPDKTSAEKWKWIMWIVSARPALSNRVQIQVILKNEAEKLHRFLTVTPGGKQVKATTYFALS